MDLELTTEQQAIRDVVRQFAQQRILPRAAEIDETDEFFWDLYHEAGELGILGLELAKEEGGAGADPVSVALATIEMARCSVVVANSVGGAINIVPLLARYGTPAQKEKWLSRVAGGQDIIGWGITEPGAGSDVSSISTRAVRDGDGYRLNGTKIFTSHGSIASLFFVLAYTDPSRGTRGGMTIFVVDPKTPGVTIGASEKKLGQKGAPMTTEYFADVRLRREDILGQEGDGFRIAQQTLDAVRIGAASQALGASEACFELARSYAAERVQFGQPIANFQMIQAMLADMAMEIEAGRLLIYRAALARAQKERCRLEASMAKVFCSDHAMKHASDCIQILGGYGYTKSYPAERFFRDVKAIQIYDGTSQIHRWIIARQLMREIS